MVVEHDSRPRLARSLLRNTAKFWGPLAMSAASSDYWDGSPIANALAGVFLFAWALGLAWGGTSAKRALHDRIARTRVVYDLGKAPP